MRGPGRVTSLRGYRLPLGRLLLAHHLWRVVCAGARRKANKEVAGDSASARICCTDSLDALH